MHAVHIRGTTRVHGGLETRPKLLCVPGISNRLRPLRYLTGLHSVRLSVHRYDAHQKLLICYLRTSAVCADAHIISAVYASFTINTVHFYAGSSERFFNYG
jgi:hypothetical protein